ncbi:MAG: copper-binding protein, partial [Rhodobacterales bacterium]|nr:copper-binding protein [Rhodobacterales bacterium]
MSMPRSLPLLAALLLALVAVAAPAGAATSDWAATDQTRVRLIAASDTLGDGHDLRLGLEFHLDEGWKVYWRSPGDAGYPPRVDWSGSENLADVDMRWPAPLRFSVVGLETLGYKKDVVFPLAVRAENPDAPLRLRARVDYLTCAEICIPYTANLALDLPAGPAAPAEEAHLIDRYRARVPGDGAAHGLDLVRAVVPGDPTDGDSQVLTVTATARTPFQAPDLYVEGPPELIPGKPAVTLVDGGRTAHLAVPVAGLRDLPDGARLSGRDLTLTLVDGDRSAEARLNVATGAAPAATPGGAMADGRGLLAILALAVLGGLILNLMPCVLPVLSIKVLGVMGHGGGDRGRVRLSFLASAAGILVSFLALAGTLIALKAGGMAVGWGIQFQHPWFLTAMMLVVGLFACNLWGFFEVRLPGWLSSVGSTGNGSHGLGGHFLGGVFATLLATPCSAPFLGTAVGFAFAAGPAEILAVFAALGLGLALPYLGVAALPGLATRLPRPGPWMDKLRIVLGLALAATGVWLLTVLAAQVGKDTAGVVGALVVVGGAALYL